MLSLTSKTAIKAVIYLASKHQLDAEYQHQGNCRIYCSQ